MSDVAVVQLVTFLTVVAGFAYQAFHEARKRKWEIEDRKMLAEKVISTAQKVEAAMVEQTEKLHDAIKENTEISTKAFHEANSVNVKIESLGLEHNALQRERQEQQADHD